MTKPTNFLNAKLEVADIENELSTLKKLLTEADAIKSRIDELLLDQIWSISNKTPVTKKSISSEERKKSMQSILRETFLEFSKRSNVDGYVKIFEYDNVFVKLFWILVLLTSLSVTAWMVNGTVQAYLQYGVTSQIGVVYELPTEFPAVTICDANQFNSKQSENFMYPIYTNNKIGSDWTNLYTLSKMAASDPNYNDSNRKQLGFNIGEYKLTCKFNETDCVGDLHWYWDYDYGNCYQFNMGLNANNSLVSLKQTYGEGPQNGLNISLSND